MSNAGGNAPEQAFVWICVLISLGDIPRNGIAGHAVALCLTF